ncbi:hypothetical protein [Paenibacillus sp. NEAU-GSW1]|uniref:hypothetical protein n=1 Tax=Paenibacillus sp. NEAU-GSW1 TaxID=2682486 RepID=UPI0012E1D12F|nr:hypothetical protein [Paenibacillus sp. NEAU-GSW1]MUT66051.1 hypothetical protein [Paenibacillus sp. NEAU-GSW1]
MITVQINVNWSILMPQLADCIKDLTSFGYTMEDINKSLSDRHNWTESNLFRRQEFNYENARFTLTQLCNLVELLTGNDLSFLDELRGRIQGLLREVVAA